MGIAIFLLLDYVTGLTVFGNLLPLPTLALGYVLSGRARWKVPWKPHWQFFTLFPVVVLSILLYTLGPDHVPDLLSLSDIEYLKLNVPIMLRFATEVGILIAVMHLGKGAKEWVVAVTR